MDRTCWWCLASFLVLCSFAALLEAAPRGKNGTIIRSRSRGKSFSFLRKQGSDVNRLLTGDRTTCQFGGKLYSHGGNVSRSDPCEKCLCFRGEVICWDLQCPSYGPRPNCREVKVPDICCPVLECDVQFSPTTKKPPKEVRFPFTSSTEAYDEQMDCEVDGEVYKPQEVIPSASGPCMECRCGDRAQMKCTPRPCQHQYTPLAVSENSELRQPVRIVSSATYRRRSFH